MCQSKESGGKRCSGSATGSSLYALYIERKEAYKANDEKSFQAVQNKIDSLKKAKEKYGDCVSSHHIPTSAGVDIVLDAARKSGTPLLVGGVVRDSFLGAENKDIDIEVHGTNIDTLVSTLRKEGFTVDEVGKQFGVLKVSKRGVVNDIDVSVPRKENNVSAGHRGFEVEMNKEMTVEEAAARRDYTFNAVMYDPEYGVAIDPYNGIDDLRKNKLKHVSPAFKEDPLRVLRGFQMAGRFNMKMDPDTVNTCQSIRKEYDELSVERVSEEWEKFYSKSTNPEAAVKVLKATGWDDTSPGLRNALSPKTVNAINNLPKQDKAEKIILGAATISRNMSNEDRKVFIQTTVVGSKSQQTALTLAEFDAKSIKSEYDAKKAAKNLQKKGFTFDLYESYSQMEGDNEGLNSSNLARKAGVSNGPEKPLVQGRDIIDKTTVKPGKWVSEILSKVEDRQYHGDFKSKDEALMYATSLLPSSKRN